MKKRNSVVAALLVSTCLILGSSTIGLAAPVEMKFVNYFPKNHPLTTPTLLKWIDMVNEGLKGQVTVKYVGGPEAIPPTEQIEAVRNNMVQVIHNPVAVHRQVAPRAAAMVVGKFDSYVEMRKSPFTDYLVKEYEKIGVRYIAPGMWGRFSMWSKKPIKKLADLKGLKMRSFFNYDRFQQALGITPVTIAMGELYTGLERGVVDGFCFPFIGPRDMGLTKSAKYVISHLFWVNDMMILMNLDVWNKLPKDVQKKIEEVTADQYEPYMMQHAKEMEMQEAYMLGKTGVEWVVFEPDEAKQFVDTAYRVKWEELGEKVPAEEIAKLKKLTLNE